jgi:ribosomal protein S27E
MKESNPKVVVTCEYHGCVLAIGERKGNRFETEAYTSRFMKRGEKCISCSNAKIYFPDDEGRIRERSGAGKTGIERIRLRGREMSDEEIAKKARELGFLYL